VIYLYRGSNSNNGSTNGTHPGNGVARQRFLPGMLRMTAGPEKPVSLEPKLEELIHSRHSMKRNLTEEQKALVEKIRATRLVAMAWKTLLTLRDDQSTDKGLREVSLAGLELVKPFYHYRNSRTFMWRYDEISQEQVEIMNLVCREALLQVGWSEKSIENELMKSTVRAINEVLIPKNLL
jgi:hypothetical protein